MNTLSTNERITRNRRLAAIVMLIVAIAMCATPAIAYGSWSFSTNITINIRTSRPNANSRPAGYAVVHTRNNSNSGIRAHVTVVSVPPGSTAASANPSGWAQLGDNSSRTVGHPANRRSIGRTSQSTRGTFHADGVRRAVGSTTWNDPARATFVW